MSSEILDLTEFKVQVFLYNYFTTITKWDDDVNMLRFYKVLFDSGVPIFTSIKCKYLSQLKAYEGRYKLNMLVAARCGITLLSVVDTQFTTRTTKLFTYIGHSAGKCSGSSAELNHLSIGNLFSFARSLTSSLREVCERCVILVLDFFFQLFLLQSTLLVVKAFDVGISRSLFLIVW